MRSSIRLSAFLLPLLLAACETGDDPGKGGAAGGDGGGGASDTGLGSGTGGSGGDGSGTGDGDTDTGPTAASLSCTFADARLDSDWDAPSGTSVTATGTWSDGTEQDVTLDATWELTDGPGGTLASGSYTAPPRGAGLVTATVTWEGLAAECTVETYLEAIVDLTGDPAIEGAVGAT